ncbi:MAG: MiaB/RimO family radical SAM methylthiotransferase [Parcubacteria group bacterium]|jgi:tRNA-2-methylthio-N6-dimethylallyladenosine synthase
MTYFLKIFGCQMNYSDAERIATILKKNKLKPAASIDAADLIVFVTCGVRQTPEDRVYGLVHNLRKKYPKKKIILTGCLAHRKDVRRRLKGKVDLFCEIKYFPQEIIESGIMNQELWRKNKNPDSKFIIHNSKNKPCNDYLKIEPTYTNKYTAYIPVMTGCNNFCAYCVVPYARGREYSRPAENILKEVRSLVKKGYREIFLLGQNVNSYKNELGIMNCESGKKSRNHNSRFMIHDSKKQAIGFADLLRLIDVIPGNFWLTFLTSHPKDMSDELIETISKCKKVCEYVSLPAQSGDDTILRKMNRKYTTEHYKCLIKKIRRAYLETKSPIGDLVSKLPPAVSTDIIVGFPGETKNQFENTAKLFRDMKFDMAYIAQYSPRPETAAWKMKDNVSKKEKVRREKVLTEILKKTALANNKKYVRKSVEVLVDKRFDLEELRRNVGGKKAEPWTKRISTRILYRYSSHTRTQKKVIFSSNKKIPIGSFQKVKIEKAKPFGLEGISMKILEPAQ